MIKTLIAMELIANEEVLFLNGDNVKENENKEKMRDIKK